MSATELFAQATSAPEIVARLRARQGRIGVVGLGYVGLPLALLLSGERFPVTGFDVDEVKVRTLNSGGSYIVRILPDEIQSAQRAGFAATNSFS